MAEKLDVRLTHPVDASHTTAEGHHNQGRMYITNHMHATMGGGIVVNSVLELAISLTSRPTGNRQLGADRPAHGTGGQRSSAARFWNPAQRKLVRNEPFPVTAGAGW
jgi:hypothetical protein